MTRDIGLARHASVHLAGAFTIMLGLCTLAAAAEHRPAPSADQVDFSGGPPAASIGDVAWTDDGHLFGDRTGSVLSQSAQGPAVSGNAR